MAQGYVGAVQAFQVAGVNNDAFTSGRYAEKRG